MFNYLKTMSYLIKSSFLFCFIFIIQSVYAQIPDKPVSMEDSLIALAHARKAYTYAFKLSEYKKALLECDTAIKFNPKSADFHSLKSDVCFGLNDYVSALKEINLAIEINPLDPDFYINKSNTLIKMKDYKAAYEDLIKAKSLDSLNSLIYLNMGRLHEGQGEYKLALADYDKAALLKKKIQLFINTEQKYIIN